MLIKIRSSDDRNPNFCLFTIGIFAEYIARGQMEAQVLTKKWEMNFIQVHLEIAAWRRVLSFMIEENILQKDRLSQVLKSKTDTAFLEQAENFLGRFIRKDALMNMLRSDLYEVEKKLQIRNLQETDLAEIRQMVSKIRHDIMMLERNFCRLMLEFNMLLCECHTPDKYSI